MREALLAAVVLICPLMMLWMMRGGHGHGGHGHGGHGGHGHGEHNHDLDDAHAPLMRERSTRGLHELRDEIERMIDEREQADREHSEGGIAAGSRE